MNAAAAADSLPSPALAAGDFDAVLAAAARIAGHAHATPVLRSRTLDALAGCELHFKAEHLQRSGAFKFRGACNAVWSLDDAQAVRGVVTHSSGNRSEEHTSELQSLMRSSYAVFCLKKKIRIMYLLN